MATQAIQRVNGGSVPELSVEDVGRLVLNGDLKDLSPEARIMYYRKRCLDLGIDPLSKPFDLIVLNGKLILYANKGCFEQLRALRRISINIVARERFDDLFSVTARATLPDGRTDESIGAVMLGTLKGEAAANAIMKAETKAKRRVTLSICGLGMMDETEVDTVKGAVKVGLDESGEVVGDQVDSHGHRYLTAWKGRALGDSSHIFEKGSHDYCPGCEKLWLTLTDAERETYRKAYTAWLTEPLRDALAESSPSMGATQPSDSQSEGSRRLEAPGRTPLVPVDPDSPHPFKEWLEAMQKSKTAIGETDYYRILKENGYTKSNQVKQLKDQRKITQEMADCQRFQESQPKARKAVPKDEFLDSMKQWAKDLGKDTYFRVLGLAGYEQASDITSETDRQAIKVAMLNAKIDKERAGQRSLIP